MDQQYDKSYHWFLTKKQISTTSNIYITIVIFFLNVKVNKSRKSLLSDGEIYVDSYFRVGDNHS